MKFCIKLIIGLAIALVIASFLSSRSKSDEDYSEMVVSGLQSTISQIKQWFLTAKQDANPLLALLHINTAQSLLQGVQNVISVADAQRLLHVDILDMKEELVSMEQKLLRHHNLDIDADKGIFV